MEERLPGERLAELVELGDPAALLRAVDGLCASRDWAGLVDLRHRLEEAVERGRPLWPVTTYVEYRLAHDAPYPGGAEDVSRAADWAARELPRHGIQPRRIFLVGHSAGGTHVATCLFDPEFQARPQADIAGVVLVSARLKADVLPGNPNAEGVRAYFGADAALYERRSPLTHAHRGDVPLMIAIAEHENPYLDLYGAEFFQRASAARARKPRFVQLMQHNHTSIVAHFNSGEETLGREILDFIAQIPS